MELDMNFTVAELADGMEKLLRKRGAGWRRTAQGPDRVVLETRIDGHPAEIRIEPTPPGKLPPMALAPRTLLIVASAAPAAALESLRKEILLAFLRASG
jgi:hypothetical protein